MTSTLSVRLLLAAMWPQIKRLLAFASIGIAAWGPSSDLLAQPKGCVRLDDVGKWEIIDSTKALAYDKNDQYLAFVSFSLYSSANYLKPGGVLSLRFFSPSICRDDNVIVNGFSTRVGFVEIVRRN